MKKLLLPLCGLALLHTTNLYAGDLGINVILSGEIKPGVYGQVELGNTPRPPVVYERPRVIVVDQRYEKLEPIYLHVPPGHARHWEKHCREYNACERRVYFVRSEEYEPDYEYRRDHERRDDDDHRENHGRGHDREHGHDD